MTHTQGPWKIMRTNKGNVVVDENCRSVTNTESDKRDQANLLLIASAPELVEVCKEALRYLSSREVTPLGSQLFGNLTRAINKAEGK